MKRSLIVTGMLIFSYTFTSCDKLDKIKEKLSQNDTKQINPFSVNSGDENRDIIAFNNKVVKMDDAQSDFIKDLRNSLVQMDTYVKNASANPQYVGISPLFTPVTMWVEQEIKAPDVLGKEYQVLVDKMKDTAIQLKALKKELEVYKDAEDWKDDKGRRSQKSSEKAEKLIKENRSATSELFTKLTSKADKAEMETLKDHPLKKQIIQSREAMELTQKIIDDSYEVKDLNAYKAKFAQQYQQMEKLYARNIEEKFRHQKNRKKAVIWHLIIQ
jgi:hypothetical protein